MAKLLTPDHRFITVRPADRHRFTAKELRALVGGDFTVLVNWRGQRLVVNAGYRQLPRNAWASSVTPHEHVGGHAVLCKPSELGAIPLAEHRTILPSLSGAASCAD